MSSSAPNSAPTLTPEQLDEFGAELDAVRARVARELFAMSRGTTIVGLRDETTVAAVVVAASKIALAVEVDQPAGGDSRARQRLAFGIANRSGNDGIGQ